MPDGPRYEDDFYAWTQYQAQVLRTLCVDDSRFDRDNLVEEIESLGRSERNVVRSQVRRILTHLLKLAYYSPARELRFDWMSSIIAARTKLADKLSPSLRDDIEQRFVRLYAAARRQAAVGLPPCREDGATALLPAECPYTIEQILSDDWYPEPPASEEARTDR